MLCAFGLALVAPPAALADDMARAEELNARLIGYLERSALTTIDEETPHLDVSTAGFAFTARRIPVDNCRFDWTFRSSRYFSNLPTRTILDLGCDGSIDLAMNNETEEPLGSDELIDIAPELIEALRVAGGLVSASIQYSGSEFSLNPIPEDEEVYNEEVSSIVEQLRERALDALANGSLNTVSIRVNSRTDSLVTLRFSIFESGNCRVEVDEPNRNLAIHDGRCDGRIDFVSRDGERVPFEMREDGHEVLGALRDMIAFFRPAGYYRILSSE